MKAHAAVLLSFCTFGSACDRAPAAQKTEAYMSAKEVLEMCTDEKDRRGAAACQGYILGVVDAVEAERMQHGDPKWLCADVNVGEIVDITTRYLKSQTDTLRSGAVVVREAIESSLRTRC